MGADAPRNFSAAVRVCPEEVRSLLDPVVENIVSMGVVPVSGLDVYNFSYLEHEDDVYSPRTMFTLDLSRERWSSSG